MSKLTIQGNAGTATAQPPSRSFPRLITSGIAAVAVVTGLLVGGASPASALGSCNLAQWSQYAQVKCTTGSGQVRAAIGCVPYNQEWAWYARTGPWVGINQTSQAACKWYEHPKVINNRVVHYYEGR